MESVSTGISDCKYATVIGNYCNGQQELNQVSYQAQRKVTIEILPEEKTVLSFITEKSQSSLGRQDIEDSFFVADLGRIFDLYKFWKDAMPNIHPYYAVKCNPDPVLLKILAYIGAGFDCASKNEIKAVMDAGASPEKIVYSLPDKQISYLQYAAANNVSLLIVDSEEELNKIKNHHPSAQVTLRLMVSRDDGSFNFNSKFGCSLEDAKYLFDEAQKLELNVAGISFHVGLLHDKVSSYDKFYTRFLTVLEESTEFFEYANQAGHNCTVLDIGGGFHGNSNLDAEFTKVATKISLKIEEFVKKFKNVQVIAEPGHYFACSPYTLASCVINKKKAKDGTQMYITTDGLHNSFTYMILHPMSIQPKMLKVKKENHDNSLQKCSIWGPVSKDDMIGDDIYLPKLDIGDWLYYDDMGAYSLSLNCEFNGFSKPSVYYFIKENNRKLIETIFSSSED